MTPKPKKIDDGFTLMFGKEFPHEWIFTDRWHALIITSKGVYYDGKRVAKGKLVAVSREMKLVKRTQSIE